MHAATDSATFLLAINFSIGLFFAAAFLALTWHSDLRLGRWCAAGFLCAALTVTMEALASIIPSPRVTSAGSYGSLMLALTLVTAGLARHYRPRRSLTPFAALCLAAIAFDIAVVFDLPRGTWAWAFAYQGPYALMLTIAAGLVIATSSRRPVDWALAIVLGLSAVQFLVKAGLVSLAGGGPSVHGYIVSTYAFYSQTAGGILSLLLGLSLIGLVVTEIMAEARTRLQRDPLSGLLNRAAFTERVPALLGSAAAPVAVILADLDHFKRLNDTFGHAAGDEVIRGFGATLRAYFEEDALLGRLGGEEFCILVPNCGPAAARIHLDALQELSRRSRYGRVPAEVAVTASFGVAFIDSNELFAEALHRADMALYDAKAAGRNTYRFAPAREPDAAAHDLRRYCKAGSERR